MVSISAFSNPPKLRGNHTHDDVTHETACDSKTICSWVPLAACSNYLVLPYDVLHTDLVLPRASITLTNVQPPPRSHAVSRDTLVRAAIDENLYVVLGLSR